MNFLPFISSLIPSILDGSKTSTYRLGLKYDHLQIGETMNIINSDTNEIVIQAIIIQKERYIFTDLPLSIPGHTPFESYEIMKNHFSQIYQSFINRPIEDDDIFLVFKFQINIYRAIHLLFFYGRNLL